MSVQRPREGLGNYIVHVAGAGAVYQEKFQGPLDILGRPEDRFVYDINPDRVSEVKKGHARLADAYQVIDEVSNLTPEKKMRSVVVIAVPDHMAAIEAFVAGGITNFIVEKPLVNNNKEVRELTALMDSNPASKVYPLDFYAQKATTLHVLTGAVGPYDPRRHWVRMGDSRVPGRLYGALNELIGPIEGISVNIVEGGSFGLSDLARRRWLEEDPERGGMLLDLGTHALAPLQIAGLFKREDVKVETAERYVFGEDRHSFKRAASGEVEVYAHASMTVNRDGFAIPFEMTVGKTFQDGGIWVTTIRGKNGRASMGLRTGDSLAVDSKVHPSFRLSLASGLDPYALAFQEADMYFRGDPRIDPNMRAMLGSISLIDEIKYVSSLP